MGTRTKFVCLCLLLGVALVCLFFTAANTIQAYQQFQQDHQHLVAGDVSTVRFWMTIPYIARVYHVPELCLDQSLHISPSNSQLTKHATLRDIASRSKQPINTIIRDVQRTILNYRQKHMSCGSPSTETGGSDGPQTLLVFLWRGAFL